MSRRPLSGGGSGPPFPAGIGPYTAAAVAAIAFDAPSVPVDGNVERVMARIHGVQEPLPAAKPRLRALALSLAPNQRPGDFAQALMDLGATVCTPRNPDCPRCPWASRCEANRNGWASELPRRLPRRARRCGAAWHSWPCGRTVQSDAASRGRGPPRWNARSSGPEGRATARARRISKLPHRSPRTGMRSKAASATCSRTSSCD